MADSNDVLDARPSQLWDANDVAQYLKVSRSWVYHRADSGLLPSLRVGGLVRFDPNVVRAFARGEDPPAAGLAPRLSPRKMPTSRGC
jgi:excisionase family DNA binding protein